MLKRLFIITLAVLMVLPVVGVSYAQDGNDPPRPERMTARLMVNRVVNETAADALGIEPRELLRMAEEDQTLNDLLMANGADSNQVAADAKTRLTDLVNQGLANGRLTQEQADELLMNLDSTIAQVMESPVRYRDELPVNSRQVLLDTAAAALGVEGSELMGSLEPNQSLGDYLSANGVDPNQVIADATAAVTAEVNALVSEGVITQERADDLLERLDEVFQNAMNFTRDQNRMINPLQTVMDTAAAALGMDVQTMLQTLADGQTLNDLLSANGVDPNQVAMNAEAAITESINAAVASGDITQERADRLLEGVNTVVDSVLNQEPGFGGRLGDRRAVNAVQTVLDTAASALGVDARQLLMDSRGQTLSEYLSANGVDPTQVSADAKTAITDALNTAVSEGTISQEQADRLLESLDTVIDRILNAQAPRMGERGERPERPSR